MVFELLFLENKQPKNKTKSCYGSGSVMSVISFNPHRAFVIISNLQITFIPSFNKYLLHLYLLNDKLIISAGNTKMCKAGMAPALRMLSLVGGRW